MTDVQFNDYISEEDREHLLSGIHRFLIWVGEPLPDIININGEEVKLHELIWDCINEKDISEQKKAKFLELIRQLENKEEYDKEILQRANLTQEEAKKLYHEIASLVRAIMDIKECGTGKIKPKEPEVKQKIEDAKRWTNFLKKVGTKS